MADTLTAMVGGHNYPIAEVKGRRALTRKTRSSQASDPAPLMVRRWKLGGVPLGKSRQGQDGALQIEWATLDHRFEDLLTSLPAVSTVTVSGSDPLSSGTAALGAMPLGGRALGGGSSLGTPMTITHVKENSGRMFVGRGGFVSQVNISSWTLEATRTMNGLVRGMENWFRKLRISQGSADAIQTVTGITTTGATYSDTQVSATDVNANEMAVIDNRLVMIRADSAGTNENRIRWTLDDFSSLSGGVSGAGFFVGDPGIPATGIADMAPFTLVNGENGTYGFTPEGAVFNVIRALRDARSANNGKKSAYQFGWSYICTDIGLYACRPGPVANPVGLSGEMLRGFEGFDGKPVACLAWREYLLVAYESSAGSTWRILLGVYGPATEGTGELDWYLISSRTTGSVREIFATSTPTNPNIGWGEGASQLARIVMGRGGGRDISDSNYVYGTGGGQWFGCSLMEQPFLRKTVRWGRFYTENMNSGNTWTLAVAFDGGSYTNIGSAVTANGAAKVIPSTPTSAPTGFLPKPRLTQVAGAGSASTTPPQLRGYLELAFDVRPDKVDEVTVVLGPLSRTEVNRLRAHGDGEDTTGRQPIEIRLHDRPGTLLYGFVLDVEDEDTSAPTVPACAVSLLTWDAS